MTTAWAALTSPPESSTSSWTVVVPSGSTAVTVSASPSTSSVSTLVHVYRTSVAATPSSKRCVWLPVPASVTVSTPSPFSSITVGMLSITACARWSNSGDSVGCAGSVGSAVGVATGDCDGAGVGPAPWAVTSSACTATFCTDAVRRMARPPPPVTSTGYVSRTAVAAPTAAKRS